jgi:putative nucleotidyltransferase with HDIG domain
LIDLDNKIKKVFSSLLANKNRSFIFQICIFGLFFIFFTVVIASGLFGSKLNIELGEPSPELITAPYDKEIKDVITYREQQELAAQEVTPVYKRNETQISVLSKEITQTFSLLKEQRIANKEQALKINELRKNSVFTVLSDKVLNTLLVLDSEEIDKAEQMASRSIIGLAGDPESGAKDGSEIASLKDEMKKQVEKYNIDQSLKALLEAYIEINVTKPTLEVDEKETEKLRDIARSSVTPIVHEYRANEKIVGPGEIVDERIYNVLREYNLIEEKSPWKPTAGIAILVLTAMVILLFFFHRITPEIFGKRRRLVLIGSLMLLVLAFGKAFLAIDLGNSDLNNLTAILIPAAWATMTVTILLGVRIAIIVAIILGIFIGIMADPSGMSSTGSLASLFALFAGLVGIQSVARLDQRSDLARAGLFIAVANVVLASGIALVLDFSLMVWLIGCLFALANGILSSILTMGALPWFESWFNITSAVRLLELSNPNAPLLKELLLEAPGTYHHSVLVGNLAETAAEEIDADPVLVRVGALYHDIGKIKRPYFFIENQFAKDNPHDKIAPTLSTLIITSHIKDGLEMAKEHKLPEKIQEIIAQHHGDSLVTFFYHKALEENPEIPEDAFRYDGIKPQSKEAALVLLADSVEAAVRSQKENTPGRIEGLVRKMIKEKFDEGLLDNCDLTFRDLDKISIAFVKVLSGIFHSRVEYPELPAKLKTATEKAETQDKKNGNRNSE